MPKSVPLVGFLKWWTLMQDYLILLPVLLLIVVGVVIALQSGEVSEIKNGRGLGQMAGNFSSLLVRVVGYLTAIGLVERIIGSPTLFGW